MVCNISTLILGVYGGLYALSSSIIAIQEWPRCIPSKKEKIKQCSSIHSRHLFGMESYTAQSQQTKSYTAEFTY